MQQKAIAFIGAGNMASSLIGGLIQSSYPKEKIFVSNPSSEKLINLKTKFGINISESNIEICQKAEVIVLCVKPAKVADVTKELSEIIKQEQLVLTVAAGITCQQIQQWLKHACPIIRCMPNTPSLIGVGATGLYANKMATNDHKQFAESLMRSVGIALWLNSEDQIDIVTALSGSGPAYFLLIFEALIAAAKELGLEENIAKLLTLQTGIGAARMAMESSSALHELRHEVTSPGGTTAAALQILEKNNLQQIFFDTLQAATNRAKEMSDALLVGKNKALEKK